MRFVQYTTIVQCVLVAASISASALPFSSTNYMASLATMVDALGGLCALVLVATTRQHIGLLLNLLYVNAALWCLVGSVVIAIDTSTTASELWQNPGTLIRLAVHVIAGALNSVYLSTEAMKTHNSDPAVAKHWSIGAIAHRAIPWWWPWPHADPPIPAPHRLFAQYAISGPPDASDGVVCAACAVAWVVAMLELVSAGGCVSHWQLAVVLSMAVCLFGVVFAIDLGTTATIGAVLHNATAWLLGHFSALPKMALRNFPRGTPCGIGTRAFIIVGSAVLGVAVLCVAIILPTMRLSGVRCEYWSSLCAWQSFAMVYSLLTIFVSCCYWILKYTLITKL
jgi:hypothetical protein